MKVKLKRGWSKTYPTLTLGNVYRVLGIEADNLRILDDIGDPVLFTPSAFEFVDAAQPATWIAERGEGGELYAYPPELAEPRHFFELFHDDDRQIRKALQAYLRNRCHAESAATPDPANSYIRVEARHEGPVDPIAVHVELDEERWEVRKVEVFRDGRVTHASGKGSTGSTQLHAQQTPLFAEIAANPEFMVTEVSRAEFEAIWDQALDSRDP